MLDYVFIHMRSINPIPGFCVSKSIAVLTDHEREENCLMQTYSSFVGSITQTTYFQLFIFLNNNNNNNDNNNNTRLKLRKNIKDKRKMMLKKWRISILHSKFLFVFFYMKKKRLNRSFRKNLTIDKFSSDESYNIYLWILKYIFLSSRYEITGTNEEWEKTLGKTKNLSNVSITT